MTAVIKCHFDVRFLRWQIYLVMCDPVLVILITTKIIIIPDFGSHNTTIKRHLRM